MGRPSELTDGVKQTGMDPESLFSVLTVQFFFILQGSDRPVTSLQDYFFGSSRIRV